MRPQPATNETNLSQGQRLINERSTFAGQAQKTVLVVDDDPQIRAFLNHVLGADGYVVLLAESGEEALQALNASSQDISLVLLDMHMEGISGLDVAREMQKRPELSLIPIIMQTASTEPDVIREGIEAGVYYCLIKPLNKALLLSLADAAILEYASAQIQKEALVSQRQGMELLETARFTCRTLKEVEVLSHLLSCSFPEPKRALIGITELLINAVEHGNLGLTYDEKTQLVKAGRWRETVESRQLLPEHLHKKVDVVIQHKEDGIYLQITDEGKGFEWWRYLEIDPARASHPNGRGIALANKISFDQLQFTQDGSRVLAVVHIGATNQPTTLNW